MLRGSSSACFKMLSVSRSRLFYQCLPRRSIRTGNPNLISEKAYQKFKLKQAKMQCESDRPLYLKCGVRDKILYYFSWSATIFSTIMTFKKSCELLEQF